MIAWRDPVQGGGDGGYSKPRTVGRGYLASQLVSSHRPRAAGCLRGLQSCGSRATRARSHVTLLWPRVQSHCTASPTPSTFPPQRRCAEMRSAIQRRWSGLPSRMQPELPTGVAGRPRAGPTPAGGVVAGLSERGGPCDIRVWLICAHRPLAHLAPDRALNPSAVGSRRRATRRFAAGP
jgi:hypothetical protein